MRSAGRSQMSSKPMKVATSELLTAFEFASMGESSGNQAFVSVKTGKTYIVSEDMDLDEEIPEGLETSDDYLCLPNKRDLGLGRDLVFSFVEEKLPDEWDIVREFFRRRGAYARFKEMLASHKMLDEWYSYEATSTEEALRRWCEDNGLQLSGTNDQVG
jgi:Uncharacterised protein family (UPF0158)